MRMRVLTVMILGTISLTLTPAPLGAQGGLAARLAEIRAASAAADHAKARALADSLVAQFGHHPNVVFARAIARAKAGSAATAADDVRRLLRWDARYARRALQDSALIALRPSFPDVDTLAERASRPVARGRVWAVLEERDLVPEGTAWDPRTRSVLVGSLNRNKIVAIAPDGTVRDRVARGASGLASVVGIHVDTRRGILWVASNPRFDTTADTTPSMLYAFDAATGAFRSRHAVGSAAGDTTRHFLNDLTTGPDGTVYVTDSRSGDVWMLRAGRATLEPFARTGTLSAPNGITISGDGRHLFVADFDHIRVVPLAGGASWRLDVPDSINVTGIDGLAFAGDALIAHHPLANWRVARYRLDAGHRAIVGRELLEANTADSRTSTTGEVVDGDYVFIGNSQIDRMNAGSIDSATMAPVRMYRVSLGARAGGAVAVALVERDSVALFDAHTLERVATLRVGNGPHEIAPAPGGRRAYVADARDTSVTVIDVLPTPRVAATWFLPDSIRVHDVAASADGRTVWAVAAERKLLLELDARSGRVRRRWPLERDGGWMVETGGVGGAVVVSHLEGGAVTVLDPRGGQAKVFEARDGEIEARLTPDGREIWSVNFKNDSLSVFDGRTGRLLSRQRAGKEAGRVVFTPDGRTALTVNGGDSTITAFDVATRTRTAEVVVPGDPKVIAVSADGRRAYVSHPTRGMFTMIDVASMTVLRSVSVPGTPDGVAVIEDRIR